MAAEKSIDLSDLKVNNQVLVLSDFDKRWYCCTIVDINDKGVIVNFPGWSEEYDENYSLKDASKLFMSHTIENALKIRDNAAARGEMEYSLSALGFCDNDGEAETFESVNSESLGGSATVMEIFPQCFE